MEVLYIISFLNVYKRIILHLWHICTKLLSLSFYTTAGETCSDIIGIRIFLKINGTGRRSGVNTGSRFCWRMQQPIRLSSVIQHDWWYSTWKGNSVNQISQQFTAILLLNTTVLRMVWSGLHFLSSPEMQMKLAGQPLGIFAPSGLISCSVDVVDSGWIKLDLLYPKKVGC